MEDLQEARGFIQRWLTLRALFVQLQKSVDVRLLALCGIQVCVRQERSVVRLWWIPSTRIHIHNRKWERCPNMEVCGSHEQEDACQSREAEIVGMHEPAQKYMHRVGEYYP